MIVGDDGRFHFNHFSLLGLDFALHDKYIPRSQFEEMLPYLTSEYLALPRGDGRLRFPLKMVVRILMINFVSALLGRDFAFEKNAVTMETQVCWKDAITIVKHAEEKLLPRVVTPDGWRKIREFDELNGFKYTQLACLALGVPLPQDE